MMSGDNEDVRMEDIWKPWLLSGHRPVHPVPATRGRFHRSQTPLNRAVTCSEAYRVQSFDTSLVSPALDRLASLGASA